MRRKRRTSTKSLFFGCPLQAVMNAYGEDSRRFAERVGVAEEVVADAVNRTCPAWELLYLSLRCRRDRSGSR